MYYELGSERVILFVCFLSFVLFLFTFCFFFLHALNGQRVNKQINKYQSHLHIWMILIEIVFFPSLFVSLFEFSTLELVVISPLQPSVYIYFLIIITVKVLDMINLFCYFKHPIHFCVTLIYLYMWIHSSQCANKVVVVAIKTTTFLH